MTHEVMGLNSGDDAVEGSRTFAISQSSRQITHGSSVGGGGSSSSSSSS
eukprot:CAMPEP_0184700666 /NCGR_PEP_ID=MMETSP0313-20130426/15211_1 /TAXON_ID=2792 /ORGANISM="Porphyridium aerugineum, Strain SAG 1380-2" /LENGTH=48 /DNA_ID= /DNA_START= /DNA_END= /DNA_ORIENTATION=